jgi:hypothetical protein
MGPGLEAPAEGESGPENFVLRKGQEDQADGKAQPGKDEVVTVRRSR